MPACAGIAGAAKTAYTFGGSSPTDADERSIMSRDAAQVFADIGVCDPERLIAHLMPGVELQLVNAEPVTNL
jgi:hypothetical protein